MAKQPKQVEEKPDEVEVTSRAKSARKLLIAALALSAASLGAGFFLARTAYQEDSAAFEPDYVEGGEQSAAEGDGHEQEADASHGEAGAEDSHAEDGHSDGEAADLHEAKADKSDDHGEEGEVAEGKLEGVLEFDEILANINGFTAQGKPTRGFVKLKLVMIYRPDPGSSELMNERQPFMRDLFNGYARSLTEADLRGMAGIVEIKAELLKRARAAAGNDLPQEILISDLIVQ